MSNGPVRIDGKQLIIPHVGRCVQCGGQNPCFMHTPVAFKRRDGSDLVFENLPHAVGAIMAKLDEVERRIKEYLPVVGP